MSVSCGRGIKRNEEDSQYELSQKKMKEIILLTASLLLSGQVICQEIKVSSGKAESVSITSEYIKTPRDIIVWLPSGYDSTKKYAVIYMNDGQMLFDSTITWNKQEWKADEVAAQLMEEQKIRPCIIVGIWNRGDYRYTEYFPQRALDDLSSRRRARMIRKSMMGEPLADSYLRFVVNELKPYIDNHYSTLNDPKNTIIIGSSMGGLISLYAICEYPGVFGGAGCLSTHLPMIGVNFFRKFDNHVARSFRNYLSTHLPQPGDHKIYFDFGTKTLDKWYGPYQKRVDNVMSSSGFTSDNWITVKYEGHNHSERSWSSRLNVPLTFLLGK